MPDYTSNDIVDILVLEEYCCNYQQAELYRDRFPDRQYLNDRIIAWLVLRQYSIQKWQTRIKIPERDDSQVVAVLAMATINPHFFFL